MDTCIWVSFFGKPSSLEKHAVDNLIDMDRIALVGPILAEVLLGFRRKDQADWVGSRLVLSHYVGQVFMGAGPAVSVYCSLSSQFYGKSIL